MQSKPVESCRSRRRSGSKEGAKRRNEAPASISVSNRREFLDGVRCFALLMGALKVTFQERCEFLVV